MNPWHLAAAIFVWVFMALPLGACSVGLWKVEQPVGEPWRAYGPILCVLGLIITGLYVGFGFMALDPANW